MSEFDASLHYLIVGFVLPVLLLLAFLHYSCGLCLKVIRSKVVAFVSYYFCDILHRRLCSKEKEMLFDSIEDLKGKFKKHSLNILEIGVGSGQNFMLYPRRSRITVLDPNPAHEYFLRKNLERSKCNHQLKGFIKAFAENMPQVESNSFDAVTCTLTLCTVRNPQAVLQEIHRVLRPGGVFYFLEHVAAESRTLTRRVQNWIQFLWFYMCDGCFINRETWRYLDDSNFSNVQYRRYDANTRIAFFFRPFMYGIATK